MLEALGERLRKREDNPFFARLPASTAPARRYLIATTARTGSTLLCSRIAEYGRLGFPNEFINESYISEFDRLFPNPSLADFERYVGRAFSSTEGVFGLKTDWWRFQEARKLALFRSFYEPLDLIVHLRREDFVAQAVSLALAVESEAWHARDAGPGGLEARHQGLSYDARSIRAHARNILNQEYYWRRFFRESRTRVMELSYEEVARDVDSGVPAIADAFQLRLGRRAAEPKMERGGSSTAVAWRDRFVEECDDFVAFWREHRGLITAA
jgi:LPS sulfotransferase NodH